MKIFRLLVPLLLAAPALAGPAPQAWLDWRQDRREELGARLSPANLAAMTRLDEGQERVLERLNSDRWAVRLATEPASGKAVGRFLLAGGTVSFSGAGSASFAHDGRAESAEDGLGFAGYQREPGRFTVLVHDLRRRGAEKRKRVVVFPYAPAAAVTAAVRRSSAAATVSFSTSDGRHKDFRAIGTLEFKLGGKPQRLTAYLGAGESDARALFLLFRDPTNGRTSYKAGRYLYLKLERPWEELETVALDLNFAFTPYCYYSAAYSCPLATDRVSVPVEAGEMARPRP